jgi:hypothetical protein
MHHVDNILLWSGGVVQLTARFFWRSAVRASRSFSWDFLFLRRVSGTMSCLVGTELQEECQNTRLRRGDPLSGELQHSGILYWL